LLGELAKAGRAGGDLLEIGCSLGFLLDEARPYFARRCGTDYSGPAVEAAKGRADEIWEGGIDEVPAAERFDCVVATQVIEHVYEPRAFVTKLIAHLRPGGTVLLTTPNMASLLRRLMGRAWPSFKVPEHVALYDGRTLPRLLGEAGLVDVELVRHPHAFPLSLIASQFGLRSLPLIGGWNVWVPTTVVAAMGSTAR
jgi:2-polyprenyl-3-methyl-5-hydroxy-6-metoxy-1,4-benzoquinol methylase